MKDEEIVFDQLNPDACRTYFIGEPGTKEAALVDPVLGATFLHSSTDCGAGGHIWVHRYRRTPPGGKAEGKAGARPGPKAGNKLPAAGPAPEARTIF